MGDLARLRNHVYERNKHDAGWGAHSMVAAAYVQDHACHTRADKNPPGRRGQDSRRRNISGYSYGSGHDSGHGNGDGLTFGHGFGYGDGNGNGDGGGFGRGLDHDFGHGNGNGTGNGGGSGGNGGSGERLWTI